MMKADPTWLPEFRARYVNWWQEARPLIEEHNYAVLFDRVVRQRMSRLRRARRQDPVAAPGAFE